MEEKVILVDEKDNQIGTEEKMQAHREGKLHRAFSVYVFNDNDELLLQQRALSKYHSGGLWTNTCCSHPREGEDVGKAAHRRLEEEMGFDTDLKEAMEFVYFADVGKGMKEHEYLHVFTGRYNNGIKPNPEEVESFKWVNLDNLEKDIKENNSDYTEWFKISIDRVLEFYRNK